MTRHVRGDSIHRRSAPPRALRTGRTLRVKWRHFPAILAALILTACEQTLERRVLEYERQLNAGNAGRVVALFADDATLQITGMLPVYGKEELLGMAGWDSVLHTRRTFYDMETSGDTVLADVIESNDWLRALGLQEISSPTTIVVFRDGLISRMEFQADTAASRAVNRSLDAVLEWAIGNRPSLVRTLISDKGFRYNAETARRWLDLIGEWKDAIKAGP